MADRRKGLGKKKPAKGDKPIKRDAVDKAFRLVYKELGVEVKADQKMTKRLLRTTFEALDSYLAEVENGERDLAPDLTENLITLCKRMFEKAQGFIAEDPEGADARKWAKLAEFCTSALVQQYSAQDRLAVLPKKCVYLLTNYLLDCFEGIGLPESPLYSRLLVRKLSASRVADWVFQRFADLNSDEEEPVALSERLWTICSNILLSDDEKLRPVSTQSEDSDSEDEEEEDEKKKDKYDYYPFNPLMSTFELLVAYSMSFEESEQLNSQKRRKFYERAFPLAKQLLAMKDRPRARVRALYIIYSLACAYRNELRDDFEDFMPLIEEMMKADDLYTRVAAFSVVTTFVLRLCSPPENYAQKDVKFDVQFFHRFLSYLPLTLSHYDTAFAGLFSLDLFVNVLMGLRSSFHLPMATILDHLSSVLERFGPLEDTFRLRPHESTLPLPERFEYNALEALRQEVDDPGFFCAYPFHFAMQPYATLKNMCCKVVVDMEFRRPIMNVTHPAIARFVSNLLAIVRAETLPHAVPEKKGKSKSSKKQGAEPSDSAAKAAPVVPSDSKVAQTASPTASSVAGVVSSMGNLSLSSTPSLSTAAYTLRVQSHALFALSRLARVVLGRFQTEMDDAVAVIDQQTIDSTLAVMKPSVPLPSPSLSSPSAAATISSDTEQKGDDSSASGSADTVALKRKQILDVKALFCIEELIKKAHDYFDGSLHMPKNTDRVAVRLCVFTFFTQVCGIQCELQEIALEKKFNPKAPSKLRKPNTESKEEKTALSDPLFNVIDAEALAAEMMPHIMNSINRTCKRYRAPSLAFCREQLERGFAAIDGEHMHAHGPHGHGGNQYDDPYGENNEDEEDQSGSDADGSEPDGEEHAHDAEEEEEDEEEDEEDQEEDEENEDEDGEEDGEENEDQEEEAGGRHGHAHRPEDLEGADGAPPPFQHELQDQWMLGPPDPSNMQPEDKEADTSEAILLARALCITAKTAFRPYLEQLINGCARLGLVEPSDRDGSLPLDVLFSLGRLLNRIPDMVFPVECQWKKGVAVKELDEELKTYSLQLVDVCASLLRFKDSQVASNALFCMTDVVKSVGPAPVTKRLSHFNQLFQAILMDPSLFLDPHDAQDMVANEGLLMACCELIAEVIGVCGPLFDAHFSNLSERFTALADPDAENPLPELKVGPGINHTFIGAMGEIVTALRDKGIPYINKWFPIVSKAASHPDLRMRRNAAYSLGAFMHVGQNTVLHLYPQVLELLEPFLDAEKRRAERKALEEKGQLFDKDVEELKDFTVDNAISSLAKMILRAPQSLDLQKYVPIFLKGLPLKYDSDENEYVYPCLFKLCNTAFPIVEPHLERVVTIFAESFLCDHVSDVWKQNLARTFKILQTKHSSIPPLVHNLPQNLKDVLSEALTVLTA